MKAKGDDFFRAGDVRSALNAYCAAIDADGNLTTCYSNRAACYLKLSMPIECKADCSIAIEHINKEIVEENSTTTNKDSQSTGNSKHNLVLVKLLMRRGTANCQLGAFNEALTDFFQAKTKYGFLTGSQAGSLNGVSLESLQADIERLRCLSEADKLKVEADAFFAEKHVDDALLKYSDALKIVPVHVGCLANRSACRFALSDFDGCIEDCSLALALLKHDPSSDRETDRTTKKVQILLGGASSDGGGNTMLQTILPPPGSEKRKLWTIKTLTRRGVAYSQLGMLEKSIADYTSAVKLDSLNEALKADLAKLINCREENQGKEINM